ncbi:helix-turn-helix transcriptional regulator [Acinetobacter baumannii]|uniref:helix-turn-helix transcriptional regulator n=1 Tax=Acinetobacter baumannii TaxID=470 RepID=UPI001CA9DC84|nr:response regulator transcription factor [Acinetobacter baumannii]UAB18933.1 helix-turn-helix transcriptional regulator [Acinetobacter baumannii]UAB22375.1 helix-turn-helix transcriptional regulator [Acinetobacter baumannii]
MNSDYGMIIFTMFSTPTHALIICEYLFSNHLIEKSEYKKIKKFLQSGHFMKDIDRSWNNYIVEKSITFGNNISFLAGNTNKIQEYDLFSLGILMQDDYLSAIKFALKFHKLTSPFSHINIVHGKNLEFLIEPIQYTTLYDNKYIFSVEYHLSQIKTLIEESFKNKAKLKLITLCYSSPEHHFNYEDHFNCEIVYNSKENKIFFEVENDFFKTKIKNLEYNKICHLLVKILENQIDNNNYINSYYKNKVINLISQWQGNFPDESIVANHFNMHPRTLRRKLAKEGESFREIINNFKKQEAIKLLITTTMSLKQISHQLGFNNSSAFCKSFKKWTGKLPKEYR